MNPTMLPPGRRSGILEGCPPERRSVWIETRSGQRRHLESDFRRFLPRRKRCSSLLFGGIAIPWGHHPPSGVPRVIALYWRRRSKGLLAAEGGRRSHVETY